MLSLQKRIEKLFARNKRPIDFYEALIEVGCLKTANHYFDPIHISIHSCSITSMLRGLLNVKNGLFMLTNTHSDIITELTNSDFLTK